MSVFSGDGSNDPNAFNIGNFYPNAFFDYLSRLMPRKLKTLFKWLEYLYVNCGQVFSVIKKFSEYPITSLTFETPNKELEDRIGTIMNKHIKIKRVLINIGIDYFVYGNSFVSVFRPFQRWLECSKCNTRHNALNHPYEWMPDKIQFKIKCSSPKCGHDGIANVKHEKLNDTKKIKVIRWDPKEIDINWNPVTGESEYYYTIPQEMKQRIKTKKPDKFLINTLPWEFLQTIKDKQIFKFREGQIYHLKNPAPAGINQEWGFPSLLGALKPYFYTAILRKGNEALALERLVPWRVLHPTPTSASNDPGQFVNLARWRNELQDAIRKWRRDPNMVKLSPIPVGVTEIGGNARPLLTHQEVAMTEENIITGMGVPKEFITGGLTHAGGSVTLRMLENLLFTYTEQIIELAQWLTDAVCTFTGIQKVTVGMVDFKLVDDIQQKQLLGQLFTSGEISGKTFLQALDLDPEVEREYILEEKIAKAKMEMDFNRRMSELQDTLASKVENQVKGNPLQYDPNAVMQVAQQEAMQLSQMPEDQRKGRIQQLEMQDPVLSACIKSLLSQIQTQQREQGAQLMQQGGGMPNGGGMLSITPESRGGGSPSTPRNGG